MRFKEGDIIRCDTQYSDVIVKILKILYYQDYGYHLYEALVLNFNQKVPYRWTPKEKTIVLSVEIIDRTATYLGREERIIKVLYGAGKPIGS